MLPKIPHVVVIGAGYAGLPCALTLGKKSKSSKKPLCRVTLINPEGRQELTCELYRTLRHGEASFLPFNELCKKSGVDFIEARVTEINPNIKTLQYRGSQSGEMAYDYLVVAAGLKRKIPEIEGLSDEVEKNKELLSQNIFFFRNNHQASALRMALNRIGFSEKTFRKDDKDFFTVILGAGTTGLEVAGELAALRGRNDKARIVLLDQIDTLLPDFSPIARKLLKKELQRMQIETLLGSPALSMNEREIHIENGQVVPWDLLIICTGARLPQTLYSKFSPTPGIPGLDTNSRFEIKNFPDHFAIGDVAHAYRAHHPLSNKVYVNKTAQNAVQEGHYIADLLANRFQKGNAYKAKPFSPTDFGYLVSLGPWSGLGRIGPAANTSFKKYFSPFVAGPLVDEMKRLASIKYRAQLEWDARIAL